jgi:hypothetical protein
LARGKGDDFIGDCDVTKPWPLFGIGIVYAILGIILFAYWYLGIRAAEFPAFILCLLTSVLMIVVVIGEALPSK